MTRRSRGPAGEPATDEGDDPRQNEGGEKLADHGCLPNCGVQRDGRASQPSVKAAAAMPSRVEVRLAPA